MCKHQESICQSTLEKVFVYGRHVKITKEIVELDKKYYFMTRWSKCNASATWGRG